MPSPRVFVSSTCYDLGEIRHALEPFIRSFGFVPVLSEKGDVFYHPDLHTHESCIKEVRNAQLCILIIGGRFGGTYSVDPTKSVTNAEFIAARECKIPIFAFVRNNVWTDHAFYQKNKDKKSLLQALNFPAIDKQDFAFHIFDFIDDVRLSPHNNGLFPFDSSSDITEMLRKQWSGMMFDFLLKRSETQEVQESLRLLNDVNRRIEGLSEQILRSVGTSDAKLTARLYDILYSYECVRDLAWFGLKPSPSAVLKHDNYFNLAEALGRRLIVDSNETGYSLSSDGRMSKGRFDGNKAAYAKMRSELISTLKGANVSPEEFCRKVEAETASPRATTLS